MASLPRRRLWKRRYSSFLHGDQARPDPLDEVQRLSIYLDGHLFDLAEKLAVRDGVTSVQKYCEGLLTNALNVEKARLQIENAEARHGTMEGLREVADDPDFLKEFSASRQPKQVKYTTPNDTRPAPQAALPANTSPETVSAAMLTVYRHAGFLPNDDSGFLPTLRRGETPPVTDFEELAQAFVDLDESLADRPSIDRSLAHALHLLAFESQVLHTDAWPDAFDAWTIDAIRAIQGAADKLLSPGSRD